MDLFTRLDEHYGELVEIRRYLHQHPELSFQEEKTARYIAEYHEKLGHEVRTNVGGNGVVAVLRGAKEGSTVALRADFDALPIQEENDVSYKSLVPNVMHACGHDGHTASLLVLAKVLNSFKEELSGNVVFIHQHAEELLPGGAISMIEDGCLEGVDVIFGNHLQAQIPLGDVICRSGPLQAAADSFQITIQGQGGHAAKPHLSKDSVVIAAQLIVNLQQIVSRRIDPLESAVLTIGSFEGINAFNVIADKVVLKGTVRTFDESIRDQMEKEMEKVIKGTCIANDATYTFEYKRGYPAVVNHVEETEFIAGVASGIPGVEHVHEGRPTMGGEDFAYYLERVKGCFIHTGAALETRDTSYPHHHPKFDIDEKGLLIAAKVLGQATVQYLEQHKNAGQTNDTTLVKIKGV